MSTLGLIYLFLQQYLVPLLFAIGLIFFIYGVIQYFIIGYHSGEEEQKQIGRENLLKATTWLVVGILVYSLVAFLGWIGAAATSLQNSAATTDPDAQGEGFGNGSAGSLIEERSGILTVPDVPQENR